MAQVRFNIGVPRAGSAAHDAESARENLRSLRPAAGSAARQAEQEKRDFQRYGVTPQRTATIRMQSPAHRTPEMSSTAPFTPEIASAPDAAPPAAAERQVAPPLLAHQTEQSGELCAGVSAGSEAPASVAADRNTLESHPLQTAAAKFKSLFRSVFGSAAGDN